MTQDEIIEMANQAGKEAGLTAFVFHPVVEIFAKLVAAKATEEANARANASWTLMCEKMVAFEREVHEHDMGILMDALWKSCGDDEEVVNATIESQGTLIKTRGEA